PAALSAQRRRRRVRGPRARALELRDERARRAGGPIGAGRDLARGLLRLACRLRRALRMGRRLGTVYAGFIGVFAHPQLPDAGLTASMPRRRVSRRCLAPGEGGGRRGEGDGPSSRRHATYLTSWALAFD